MNALVPTQTAMRPDPKIEQSLAKTAEFLNSYSAFSATPTKDVLQGQFKIDVASPLPQFNVGMFKAYAASDLSEGRPLYAVVCDVNAILRHNVIDKLLKIHSNDFVSLVAAGMVTLSQPDEERFVVFFEKPKGQKLSVMLSNASGRIPSAIIKEKIISPIVRAILVLSELGITHGMINTENIYYDNGAVIGPCIFEPCGFSQPYYYELVERIQTHPAAKGDFHEGADFYALAILVVEMLFGASHLQRLTKNTLPRTIIRKGNFDAIMQGREPPEEFYDFLYGMLGAGHEKRWNYRYLKPWLDGKHYSVTSSSAVAEAARPYEAFNTNSFSRREIALLMRENWGEVPSMLEQNSLSQWILLVLRMKDFSELVARHVKTILESGLKNETLRNEYILRLILLLDNHGPLQYGSVATHVTGIESGLTFALLNQNNTEVDQFLKFIENNLMSVWVDLQRVKEIEIPESITQMMSKFERLRNMLRNTSIGFGMERILYDLNPEMPCLSPLCRGKYINNLTALLKHLDKIAPSYASTQDPIDAHIGAFVASKLGISVEIRLHDLSALPMIANNQTLIALKLFAVAQHRSGNIELGGLTHWIAQRLLPSMQFLHSQTIRGRTLQMLLDEALDGRTQRLGDLLLDGEIINADQTGYQKALRNYKNNAIKIEHYKRATNLDRDSTQLGAIIAKIFAYMVLLVSFYKVFATEM